MCFRCVSRKVLGFIIHEHGVEIDPAKVESIRKLQEPKCKKYVQKLLGKINYLRRFISSLAGKIESFVPLLRLKSEAEFTWGAEQQEAFNNIKRYLLSPPVLRAPKSGASFRLYIAAQDTVIGAVLVQEDGGKEYIIAYLSRRLIDAETRYVFIEKLCLSLYYACTKFWPYLLSSTCVVACQADVIKYMLQQPILSGRIGKWAYALTEYDLAYESLRAMRGQVIADFIVDHRIKNEEDINYVSICPWKLYFDGSVCDKGQGVGNILISPNNIAYEASVRLEYSCTNNQAEYEALLFGLQSLVDMGVKNIDAFGDSLLVVKQITGEFQCFDGLLNSYLDRCLDIIKTLDTFTINHIPREENSRANCLAQQASGYNVSKGKFFILERPMQVAGKRETDMLFLNSVHGPAIPDSVQLKTVEVKGNSVQSSQLTELANNLEPADWRVPLVSYLKDPSQTRDRKIRRQALKYT